MRVCLVSDYLDFPELLSLRGDVEWAHLRAADPIPSADLYLWDYKPGLDLQSSILLSKNAQHIILAHPQYLDLFDSIQNSVCILLKPVNPFTLRTFIDLALKTWEARRQACE